MAGLAVARLGVQGQTKLVEPVDSGTLSSLGPMESERVCNQLWLTCALVHLVCIPLVRVLSDRTLETNIAAICALTHQKHIFKQPKLV